MIFLHEVQLGSVLKSAVFFQFLDEVKKVPEMIGHEFFMHFFHLGNSSKKQYVFFSKVYMLCFITYPRGNTD